MDTSEEYIKMCEKAEEIQKLWKPNSADFGIFIVAGKSRQDACIWLPRQDQLQEMITGDWWNFFINVINWIESPQFEKVFPILKSKEQLLLVFVMEEKYNKVWDDKKKEWIKCK